LPGYTTTLFMIPGEQLGIYVATNSLNPSPFNFEERSFNIGIFIAAIAVFILDIIITLALFIVRKLKGKSRENLFYSDYCF